MTQQKQVVLPVTCVGCGAVFDLWYDLLAREGRDFQEMKEDLVQSSEHYCWRCRQRIQEEEEKGSFEWEDVSLAELDDALELEWK